MAVVVGMRHVVDMGMVMVAVSLVAVGGIVVGLDHFVVIVMLLGYLQGWLRMEYQKLVVNLEWMVIDVLVGLSWMVLVVMRMVASVVDLIVDKLTCQMYPVMMQ